MPIRLPRLVTITPCSNHEPRSRRILPRSVGCMSFSPASDIALNFFDVLIDRVPCQSTKPNVSRSPSSTTCSGHGRQLA